MKSLYLIPTFLLAVFLLSAQSNLEVDGQVKISTMDAANDADSVVVWRADSTLARRDASTLNLSGWQMKMDTTFTLKSVGIGTSSPISFGPSGVLEIKSVQNDIGSFMQLSNQDRNHFLRLFSGRDGDADPLIWWKEGTGLRFATDEGGYSEQFRIAEDGIVTVQNRIVNVTDPVDPQDAATKAYIDLLEATIKDIVGVKDIDNNRYETVTIGSQTWMAENLRVTRFNDGTPIPLVTDNGAWEIASNPGAPAYTWYENGDYGVLDYGAPEYGALYNGFVIDTLINGNKNVCPVGWHIPTPDEWDILRDFLDPSAMDNDNTAGGKMKESGLAHWNRPNMDATNESGFSGLPTGKRDRDGPFIGLGDVGYWWAFTGSDGPGNFRLMSHLESYIFGGNFFKGAGYSIRCLKDD